MTKTIFITAFQGVEAKNLLRTPVLDTILSDSKINVVLFMKNQDRVNLYKKEFSSSRIKYEIVPSPKVVGLDALFGRLKFILLRTETTHLKRQLRLEDQGSYLHYYSSVLVSWIFARPSVRKVVRWLDYFLVSNQIYSSYFEKYKPDLVFMAHLFDEPETHLLREAKKRSVKTVGLINSWDKVTARCILRLLPDKIVVFNDIVKKEIIDYNEVKEENIFVGGLPHYDIYKNLRPNKRQDFYKNLNIKPSTKRVIIYAPDGKYSVKRDSYMIDLLHSFIKKSLIPKDVELLVRFQPNDIVNMDEIKKRPWLIYDIPGIRFSQKRGIDWDMSFKDHQQLLDTLFYSSLLICYTSSLSIDSAVFDNPIINVNFEPDQIEKLSQSPIRYYQMTHYKNAIKTGGIRIVKNKNELLKWINLYLKNPSLDQEKRKRLVREQCWKVDGKAGQRIGRFVLNYLYK